MSSKTDHLLAFEFGHRLVKERQEVKDKIAPGATQTGYQRSCSTLEILLDVLFGLYREALKAPKDERDSRFPWWETVRKALEVYDPQNNDPQPLETSEPMLDYDPDEDEFFAIVYDSKALGNQSRNVYQVVDVLEEWNRNLWKSAFENYTPGCRAVLEELTSQDVNSPRWIAHLGGVWFIDGTPLRKPFRKALDESRDAVWDVDAMNYFQGCNGTFLTQEERDLPTYKLLRLWRDRHRGRAPVSARELRGRVYEENQVPAHMEILCTLGDEKFTAERLTHLLQLEEVAEEQIPQAEETPRPEIAQLVDRLMESPQLVQMLTETKDLEKLLLQEAEEVRNFGEGKS